MATKPDMHVGDYGTTIEMTIINRQTRRPLDLATITSMYMKFEKPSGATLEKTAVMANPPGNDGVIKYVVESGLVDETGKWLIQARLLDIGGLWHTDIMEFNVAENIVVP